MESITPKGLVKVNGILFYKNRWTRGEHRANIYDATIPENIEMVETSKKEQFIRNTIVKLRNCNLNGMTYEEAVELNNIIKKITLRIEGERH